MAEESGLRVFTSHAEARAADLEERARMTMAERMRLGAELHAFWARNYYPDAKGLGRMERTISVCETFEAADDLDLEQWLAIPGRERLLAGEELREEWARRDGQSGLQRVLRVAPRSEG